MTSASNPLRVGLIAPVSLAAALTLNPIPAQASHRLTRRRITGEVVEPSGKPWSGATVVLRSLPLLPIPEFGGRDEIRVTSSRRGRFRALVISGRKYRAYAMSAGTQGATRYSAICSIWPGDRRVRLTENPKTATALRLQVLGLANWKQSARLWLIDDAFGCSPVSDGAVLRLPGESAWVELRSNAEVTLFRSWIPLREDKRRERAKERGKHKQRWSERPRVAELPDVTKLGAPGPSVERILIPPPMTVPVEVVSTADDAPVQGADIVCPWLPSSGLMRTLATTNAKGTCEVVVPHPIDGYGYGRHDSEQPLEFRVLAPMFGITRFGWRIGGRNSRVALDIMEITDGKTPGWTVDIEPSGSYSGTVKNARGAPVAGAALVYHAIGAANIGRWVETGIRVVRTDTQGRYSIPGVPAKVAYLQLAAVLPVELWGAAVRHPPVPSAMLWPVIVGYIRGGTHNVLDLARVAPLAVEIELPDGRAASGASISTYRTRIPGSSDPLLRALFTPETRTDQRGRCRILLDRTDPRFFAGHLRHYANVALAPEAWNSQPVSVELTPCLSVSGRVITRKAVPCANVWLAHSLTGRFWTDGPGLWLHEFNARHLRGRTDAEGRFRLFFAPNAGQTYELRAAVLVDQLWQWSNGPVVLNKDSVSDVTIVLDH